jgi:MATE family multidrug resistance protein
MCTYGFPNGVRYVAEILAWNVFLLLLGRVDADGLAASNIVWRINGMAFFPVIGLSGAVAMLVGQAQGASRPDLSRKVTHRGLVLGQIWMASAALAMVLFPNRLLDIFLDAGSTTDHELRGLCVKLLWFVAVYCLVDGLNIVFMSVLAGAGDTRWMLIASGGMHGTFMLVLMALARWHAGVFAFWLSATVFIFSVAIAWITRFRSGKWENKRVIEHAPPDFETTPVPGV